MVKKKNHEQYTVIEHDVDQGGLRAHMLMIPEPDITIRGTNNEQIITKLIWNVIRELGYL